MRQTSNSFAQRRLSNTSTPISVNTIRSKRSFIKQQKSISDVYHDVRQKIYEMQSAFKQQQTLKQRQMLKTYIKILDKIGAQVMQSKQKYRNLDKQTLKTDKRLQIVTELNKKRQNCKNLFDNIKNVKQEIKRIQDQNNYLQKQVQALQNIENRKRSLSKNEKIQYKEARKGMLSLQKRSPQITLFRNQQNLTQSKPFEYQPNTFDLNNRAASLILNDFNPQKNLQKTLCNQQTRPHTTKKDKTDYLGSKRRKNKLINLPFDQNVKPIQFI